MKHDPFVPRGRRHVPSGWPDPSWARPKRRWYRNHALILTLACIALALLIAYVRPVPDQLEEIRKDCRDHHGVPANDVASDGRVLAIRCALYRGIP